MHISTFVANARRLAVLLLVLAAASLCNAANITYSVNLTIGAGGATGDIVTDGTIGSLTGSDILDWNLLVNDGSGLSDATFDLLGPLSGGNAGANFSELLFVAPPLSANATQLLFDFDYGSNVDNFVDFVGAVNNFPQYSLCFFASPDTCYPGNFGGGEDISFNTFTGAGDIAPVAYLSGTQVIGTAAGSSTPEPSTLALLGAGIALLRLRKRSIRRQQAR